MKKLLTIPLLFIYLVAVSGIMINLHYCGQQLESWNLFADKAGCAEDSCGDESEENDDCCKDEVVVAKMSQEQNTVSQLVLKFITTQYTPLLPQYYCSLPEAVAPEHGIVSNYANAPPGLWQQIPLYKLHSNFTYYG